MNPTGRSSILHRLHDGCDHDWRLAVVFPSVPFRAMIVQAGRSTTSDANCRKPRLDYLRSASPGLTTIFVHLKARRPQREARHLVSGAQEYRRHPPNHHFLATTTAQSHAFTAQLGESATFARLCRGHTFETLQVPDVSKIESAQDEQIYVESRHLTAAHRCAPGAECRSPAPSGSGS